MNKRAHLFIFLAVLFAIGICAVLFLAYTGHPLFRFGSDMRYRDAKLPVEARIESLLSQMTLAEKIGQMALVEKNSVHDSNDIAHYGLGGMLSGGGAKPENNTPQGWLAMVRGYEDASRRSRLGIPVLYGIDAIHGNSNVPGATIFPHAIGLGASGERELVKKIGEATAEEVKAIGISWIFSPNLDAPQDIRWGRVYEAYSSDARINADLGSAFIEGVQGTSTGKVSMLATAKHYLGAGAMAWGTSSGKEYLIDQGTTPPDESAMRQFYLPPFKAAVHAGVLSVMVGLNSYGPQKMSTNSYLLTTVLKNELGFKGFVVSDWYGVYEIPGGKYAAAVKAINAGVDMAMLPYDYTIFSQDVTEAVRKGDIAQARIDDAVRRILRAKFTVGLFEEKSPADISVIGSKADRDLAREAVAKSLVLLKNEQKVLPVPANTERIFVSGSAADNTGRQSGGWTIEWQGIDGNTIQGATSLLQGIRETAPRGTEIIYDSTGKFVNEKRAADIGIAIVGEKPYSEGVGDTPHPTLSDEDLAAISVLRKVSEKVVVIIVSGRPLLLPKESLGWDAIVAAWLPGSEGAGVADVLFGKKPFTGKLPLPWPADLNQLPFSPDGVAADRTTALFPLGFGL